MTSLVWPTGRSSQWYGTCAICGELCREMFVAAKAAILREHPDGSADMRPVSPWHYGHHACITAKPRHHINTADLPRVIEPGTVAWRVPAAQVRP